VNGPGALLMDQLTINFADELQMLVLDKLQDHQQKIIVSELALAMIDFANAINIEIEDSENERA
jgi:hypothetical protein